MNQSDFAALGGVGLQTQSRYEKAETEPSAGYLAGLAEAGIDVHYLLTGTVTAKPDADEALSRALDGLPSPIGEVVIDFVSSLQSATHRMAAEFDGLSSQETKRRMIERWAEGARVARKSPPTILDLPIFKSETDE